MTFPSSDVEKTAQDIYRATSDASSSDSNTFVAKLEHPQLGYGEDRDATNAQQIKAEVADAYVHQHMNWRLFVSLTAMSSLWIGSQIPLYFYGSVLPRIYSEVGGADGKFIWLIVGYLIPNAALCPFVGALSDLFGRKVVAMVGQVALVIGPVVVSSAQSIDVAILGMVIAGFGAGLNELIALAGTSELVPVPKRPRYITAVVLAILPFSPATLWANLIVHAFNDNWRWVGIFVAPFNFLGLLLVIFGYKEPPVIRPHWRQIVKKVDFVGGFLSIAGLCVFFVGMIYGAQQYSWKSATVLAPIMIGAALIVAFFIWEIVYAPHPMVPKRLFSKDQRTMIALLVITFFSGGTFFNVILFWPPETYNVYGEDYIQNGLQGLPIGLGITFGSCIALTLIGLFRGRVRMLTIFWCIFMTAFTGGMSAVTTSNLVPTIYIMITLSAIGVGAVIIPCSILAQAITPVELIGTITAITLALRYIGGCIAFTVYYNVLLAKFYPLASGVGLGLAQAGVSYDYNTLVKLVTLAARAQYDQLRDLIATSSLVLKKDCYDLILTGTKEAWANAYRYPYWVSIVFGGISIIAACFLKDVKTLDSAEIAEDEEKR